ncbi:hypothetical protein [Dickeya chrysanthemi]|uniref:hypothetical protein n=1 Tax=Dickeya chrysanthemi TaxID=556 RepID=UPI001CF47B0A|nr:hypothetical protein [Dickeya chrysanthemi]MCA7008223.1 hypothetical protein [Dickeya chrysanthemi]
MMKKTLATLVLAVAVLPVAALAADPPAKAAGVQASNAARGSVTPNGYTAGRAIVSGFVSAVTSTATSTTGTSTSTVTSTRG